MPLRGYCPRLRDGRSCGGATTRGSASFFQPGPTNDTNRDQNGGGPAPTLALRRTLSPACACREAALRRSRRASMLAPEPEPVARLREGRQSVRFTRRPYAFRRRIESLSSEAVL